MAHGMGDESIVDEHLVAVLNEVLDAVYQAKQAAWSASTSPVRDELRDLVSFLIDQSGRFMVAEERIDGRSAAVTSPSSHQRGNLLADAGGDVTVAVGLLARRLETLVGDVRRRVETMPDVGETAMLVDLADQLEARTRRLQRGDEPVSDDVLTALDRCTATCQLLADQDEGPYRRGAQPRRRDVVDDRPGRPLTLGLRLRWRSGGAAANDEVEIWHCDAGGRYSGYPPNDAAVAVDARPQRAEYLPDESFLRGRQTTDDAGNVEFRTIYPGWYPGRTVHIHLMVHTPERTYTTQLYFPEDVTAEVFARDPYRDHGLPDTTHGTDAIFATGGHPAVLDTRDGDDGKLAVLCLVLPEEETE